jgi:RNA polymerase sigma factor (sigma-70 family)
MTSLLLTSASPASILPVDRGAVSVLPLWMLIAPMWHTGTKELAVGDEQDARFAARQAEIEQTYEALPATGTPEYWQALEGAHGAALPLEVLVHCYRERIAAGAREDSGRIYELVQGRAQHSTQYWARKIAHYAPAHARPDLEERLEDDCYVELWRVMEDRNQAFILINFFHVLTYIQEHVAHDVMQKQGYWIRPGVEKPRRVPRKLMDSTDQAARQGDEPDAVALPIPDPRADEAFSRVEVAADMEALLAALPPDDRALLYDLYCRGLTQDEIAAKLHITDRTVRNRLTRILAFLRSLLTDEEEPPHGD